MSRSFKTFDLSTRDGDWTKDGDLTVRFYTPHTSDTTDRNMLTFTAGNCALRASAPLGVGIYSRLSRSQSLKLQIHRAKIGDCAAAAGTANCLVSPHPAQKLSFLPNFLPQVHIPGTANGFAPPHAAQKLSVLPNFLPHVHISFFCLCPKCHFTEKTYIYCYLRRLAGLSFGGALLFQSNAVTYCSTCD